MWLKCARRWYLNEFESFTVISTDSLILYDSKHDIQVYLGNYAYKIAKKQMTDFLDEDLILWIMFYSLIYISEGTDLAKSNNSKECIICLYWFLSHGVKFHVSVYNGCYAFAMLN